MRDGDGERERNRNREKFISTCYIYILKGRLRLEFIFDIPKEPNFPYILKAFDKYLLNKCINESNQSIKYYFS